MKMKKKYKGLWIAAAALLLLAVAVGAYASDYYRAEEVAVQAMADGADISVEQMGNLTAFLPEKATAGFIFYPGGKVEHTAYAPLLQALAREEILCVLVQMPLNLAVLDVDAAEGIRERFPEVECWYIGGHSLGGSMAASWAADNADALKGLVLLAAYSTEDLTRADMKVLSLYGSEDRVLNLEKYAQYRENLPEDTQELAIPGGNHAQFGSYGSQEGDGTASISGAEQLAVTVQSILEWMKG